MILNVPFKRRYLLVPFEIIRRKDIEFIISLATLEMVCEELKIEFWQIKSFIKQEGNNYDFTVLLLYCGYIRACEKRYRKPRYDESHARIWFEMMGTVEMKKFTQSVTELFGKFRAVDKKKAGAEVKG